MLGTRAVALVFFASATLAESTCCCLKWLPEVPESAAETDEPAIERAARERAESEGRALLASSEPGADAGVDDAGADASVEDAGPTRRSECVSGVGALAFDLGVAVITRGHAGGDPAAQVTFDPAACARRLVVYLVKRGAVFVVVAMVVHDRLTNEEVARSGTPPEFTYVEDVDYGSDEIF